jgi:hypothetical protein
MSLPLDLLLAIAEQLKHEVAPLKALSLTCKGLSAYCQRRLFRSIDASIVIGMGGLERGAFGPKNPAALFSVIAESSRLASYVKRLYLSLDCPNSIIFLPETQAEWFSHDLPEFMQNYLQPLLSKLSQLEVLRLHSILMVRPELDPIQFIGIFRAISSPSISHIAVRNLPFAPPESVKRLSRLELWNAPWHSVEKAQNHLKALETLSYLNEVPLDTDTGSNHAFLKEITDSNALDLAGLRQIEFGSHCAQDHHEAVQILTDALGNLEKLVYVFPTFFSGGGKHTCKRIYTVMVQII